MGILDSLFGSPLQNKIDMGLESLYGMAPQGSPDLLAGPGGFAGPMGGMSEQGALPSPESYNADDIVVEGFKPKKRSFLGFLADAFLMSRGGQPLFAQRIFNKNYEKAMQGFADDPLEAMRRVSKIPHGGAEKAYKMFEKYRDDERADGTLDRQNRALDMKNDDYIFSRVAGMMSTATPENWHVMRDLAIKRAAARGVDVESIIPPEYDQDSLEFIRYGEVKPKDYDRLRQQQQRVDQLERDTDSKIADREVDNRQAATNEAGRNTRAANAEAGKNRRYQPRKNGDGSKTIMTPGGRQFTISPSGMTGVVTEPDGTKHVVEKFGNGWKLRKK